MAFDSLGGQSPLLKRQSLMYGLKPVPFKLKPVPFKLKPVALRCQRRLSLPRMR